MMFPTQMAIWVYYIYIYVSQFGRVSGFVGLFKPVSIHKVTFLSVHSSAQIGFSGGRGPGVSCRSIEIPFSVLRSFPAFAD